MGGSAKEIETIIEDADRKLDLKYPGTSRDLRFIMKEMLLDAKVLDVYFIHMDISGHNTKTLSSIRVNKIYGDFKFSSEARRKMLWQSFARLEQEEAAKGSVTVVAADRSTTTAYHPAYEVTFKTTEPGGSVVYKVLHFVELEAGEYHMFQLKCDGNLLKARLIDFHSLLASVRYKAQVKEIRLADNEILVRGSKIAWAGNLPKQWFGGNAQAIERMIKDTDDEDKKLLAQTMLPRAKKLDIYFIHLNLMKTRKISISSIFANMIDERTRSDEEIKRMAQASGLSEADIRAIAQEDYTLSDRQLRKEVWQKHARLIEMDEGQGAETVLTADREIKTGNRPAYEATFKTTLPEGEITYTVVHIVELEEGKKHLFQLEADGRQFDARLKDFRGLLASVYYGPVVVKEADSQTNETLVAGRMVAWTGKLPKGWIGGNATVIERAIVETADAQQRVIMRAMLSDAKALDVCFVYPTGESTTLEALPFIRVLVKTVDTNYSNELKRKEFWQAYAFVLQFEAGGEAKTVLISDRVTRTGDHQAYEATFKTIKSEGEAVYEVMHIVQLGGGRCHMFMFESHSDNFEPLLADFHGLLDSVRYK